jgi:molybdopterin-containing oxidoreductase family iron-sulfur binding subunit
MNHFSDPNRLMTQLPIIELDSREPADPAPPLFWRSLDEWARSQSPDETSEGEFADPSIELLDGSSRRQFLRFMGASLALGGVSGCAFQPAETIVPYVRAPEFMATGKFPEFASAIPGPDGYMIGVLVKTQTGRPIKIEGNPDHPASLGSADSLIQAALLGLYDPDRSQLVTHNGRIDTWEHLQTLLLDLRQSLAAGKGAGLRFLTATTTSPTVIDQFKRLAEQFPESRWHVYESVSRDSIRLGAKLAFGEEVEPVFHLEKANVILALDADFLAWGSTRIKDARAFAKRREVGDSATPASMNRLYAAECTPSITGAAADHRLAVSAHDIAVLAQAIAGQVGVGARVDLPPRLAKHKKWVDALAKDLAANRGKSLVIAGDSQPPELHALVHAINDKLGNIGKTVEFIARLDGGPLDQTASIGELVRDINAGKVKTLIILGGNPAYDAPAELDFAKVLAGPAVGLKIHLGLYDNETAEHCNWHIPEAHCLESWSDGRAFDGSVTIQQPLVAPLYNGKTSQELLALLLGEPGRSGLDLIRDYWSHQHLPGNFDDTWKSSLSLGMIPGTAAAIKPVAVKNPEALTAPKAAPPKAGLELVFRPDPTLWDGRFANNGWLQELPKPLTRLTWDNAALISPALAEERGLENEDMVVLRFGDQSVTLPVWIMPGQAAETVTVTLGHGRTRAGKVGTGVGIDVSPLRVSQSLWFGSGLELTRTGERRRLAATQHHSSMEGRDLFRVGTVEEFQKNPHFAHAGEHESGHQDSLFQVPEPQRRRQEGEGNSWGMAINLNTCIGCGACVTACQAENNIPVVGRDQVLASREMHWIRVDRYFEGSDKNEPSMDFQPVPCMHCEQAPCEIVCPVGATTHSAEGLNEMTYNRCVGTRYCSNNCPYKVRRFNFLEYSDLTTTTLKMMRNPEVTVRTRGVMEKCTYCVQRINAARMGAEIENRAVRGDEVVTACQGACPTQAILFGNLNDRESAIVKAKASPRNYALLAELNTRPRTTYLAKLRNPNPEIEASTGDAIH